MLTSSAFAVRFASSEVIISSARSFLDIKMLLRIGCINASLEAFNVNNREPSSVVKFNSDCVK